MCMNRRSFLSSILATSTAPLFLKGAGRLWVPYKPDSLYVKMSNFDVAFDTHLLVNNKAWESLFDAFPWPPNMGEIISAAKGNVEQLT